MPASVAALWVPVRSSLPNTAVALVIALAVGVAALVGGRWAAVIGSLAGTVAFDVFDTAPYGQLLITRGRDEVTAVALLAAGLVIGEMSVRLRGYRAIATQRDADFRVMSGAAGLMAFGEDALVVVQALAGELQRQLDLADCTFHFGPPTGERRCVARDGQLVNLAPAATGQRTDELDLPVFLGAELAGCYRLVVGREVPSRDRLLVAAGVAEQAGAALAGARPDQPGPAPGRHLRPVR